MDETTRAAPGLDTWRSAPYSSYSIIGLYLAAIVAANVTVMIFGPAWSVVNAFLFIGFNITARDRLHDTWEGAHLKRNMLLLILAGSIISALFGAGRIAAASFIAFAASETADAIAYHLLTGRRKLEQINGSNIISAAVDSLIFPLLAFGWPPLIGVMIGQFLAKTFGGFIWSLILRKQS